VHDQKGFDEVWSSYGSGSQYRASIWRCSRSESLISKKGYRAKVFLGHFAADSLQAPKGQTTQRLEVVDTRCGGLMGSSVSDSLNDLLATYCPNPIKFRKAWSQKQGAAQLRERVVNNVGTCCAKIFHMQVVRHCTRGSPSRPQRIMLRWGWSYRRPRRHRHRTRSVVSHETGPSSPPSHRDCCGRMREWEGRKDRFGKSMRWG
jgi:hypothetical protein